MKIAVITCYSDPDYVRARSLRAALKAIPKVKPIVVKNRRTGWMRYGEIIWKLRQVRRTHNPDVYLLTFRGQEILPFVLLAARKKPVWFDEFVVPLAYANDENGEPSFGRGFRQWLARRSFPYYKRWLQRCSAVFAGSSEQAELSARISHMNLSAYRVIQTGDQEPSASEQAAITRQLAALVADAAS